MPQKLILKTSGDHEYLLIGLVTPLAGYRLCFFLNKMLGTKLTRIDDLPANDITKDLDAGFQLFAYLDQERQNEWYVLANKTSDLILMPSLKQVDFFLLIDGLPHNLTLENVSEKITKISQVQFVQIIETAKVKGIDLLLEEFEMHIFMKARKKKTHIGS